MEISNLFESPQEGIRITPEHITVVESVLQRLKEGFFDQGKRKLVLLALAYSDDPLALQEAEDLLKEENNLGMIAQIIKNQLENVLSNQVNGSLDVQLAEIPEAQIQRIMGNLKELGLKDLMSCSILYIILKNLHNKNELEQGLKQFLAR